MPHALPPLPYAYDALEPHYDKETVRLHHDMHHAAYVTGLNAAEEKLAAARKGSDFAAIQALSRQIAFHGAGHQLHSVFWTNMKPAGGGKPDGALAAQIDKDFGSFDAFVAQFKAASAAVEGSGWGVLAWNANFGALQILTAMNHQDLAQWATTPILVCDVWEHAYYLKYQNKRAAWVEAFVANLINWSDVAERFAAAKS
jgi:superoxide dismutase, Fe-Mn family